MNNWKSVVKNLAPTLATALGGPLAGTATKFLAESFLGDKNAPEAALDAALLNASPADLAKIKEIDNQFALEMSRLDVDIYALEVNDRKNARTMARANMAPQMVLSAIFIGGYFFIVYVLFSGQIVIDDSIRDMSNILLGVLTASIPSIMSFWFGSSHGSKQKTETMSNV